jgi:phosphatidylglycerophosphatase A
VDWVNNVNINKCIATFFYLGYVPGMPGTFASAATALIWFLLPPVSVVYQIIFLLFLIPLSIMVSGNFAHKMQIKDPSCVVIDEVVGMSVALFAVPQVWYIYLLAFALFRLFDITKPYPINALERLSGGWGIVIDDFVAGLFARFVLMAVIFLIPG